MGPPSSQAQPPVRPAICSLHCRPAFHYAPWPRRTRNYSFSVLLESPLLTWSSLGIGQQTAIAFAQHGVTKLALADINQNALDISARSLKKQFPHVHVLPVHLNVRDSTQVKEGIAKTIGEFGRLDIAVNNAGISGSGRKTHELDDDEWLRILDVNLQGVYRCQKEELGVMVNQEYVYQGMMDRNEWRAKSSRRDLGPRVGRGRIINVGSMFAVVAPNNQDHTAYTTAKHGTL